MNLSERIDELMAGLTDWRGKMLASIRKSILEADREVIEEWKWRAISPCRCRLQSDQIEKESACGYSSESAK